MKYSVARATLASIVAAVVMQSLVTGVSSAAPSDFFSYRDDGSLAARKPGDVLGTRTLQYHLVGVPLPVTAVQIRYRSTDALGRAASNITTVLKPPGAPRPRQAVAYQSFYDSLNPADSPSRDIAGQTTTLGGLITTVESTYIAPLLVQGYPVIVADTQGQRADFAAGPEYGYNTLDSIRAASRVSGTGVDNSTQIGLLGYSGGAIATNWAAALAASYAPDVNRRIVGAAEGGLFVNPVTNLRYVDGSVGWAGVAAIALIGIARAYGVDFAPYLSDYGKHLFGKLQNASIVNVLFQYPLLRWDQLVKPEYAEPLSVKPLAEVAKKINLGGAPTPAFPMFIGQGANGYLEGSNGAKPGIGAGDAVMVAGDVRSLARKYCDTGNRSIEYVQYDVLSHAPTTTLALFSGIGWLNGRFAGAPAPSSCGRIAPGNPI